MTARTKKVLRNGAIGLGALVVLLTAGVFIVVQTAWFRNYVRQQIIAATEEGTGGKVDIGSFDFDVFNLRAVIHNFVIHGTEPAGSAPFLQAARLELDLRLLTSIHHLIDITRNC